MGPVDCVVVAAILLIVSGATAYIIKAKKSGKKCIGCPHVCSCNKKKTDDGSCSGSSCGCHSDDR